MVWIFPNEASITRLIGGVLLRQNDEWQLQRRYMRLEPCPNSCSLLLMATCSNFYPRLPDQ